MGDEEINPDISRLAALENEIALLKGRLASYENTISELQWILDLPPAKPTDPENIIKPINPHQPEEQYQKMPFATEEPERSKDFLFTQNGRMSGVCAEGHIGVGTVVTTVAEQPIDANLGTHWWLIVKDSDGTCTWGYGNAFPASASAGYKIKPILTLWTSGGDILRWKNNGIGSDIAGGATDHDRLHLMDSQLDHNGSAAGDVVYGIAGGFWARLPISAEAKEMYLHCKSSVGPDWKEVKDLKHVLKWNYTYDSEPSALDPGCFWYLKYIKTHDDDAAIPVDEVWFVNIQRCLSYVSTT